MRVDIILLFAALTIAAEATPYTPQECCGTIPERNSSLARMCIEYCRGKKSNSRSIGEKEKSFCSKYDEIVENCWNPNVDKDLSESDAGPEKAVKAATVGKFVLLKLIDEPKNKDNGGGGCTCVRNCDPDCYYAKLLNE